MSSVVISTDANELSLIICFVFLIQSGVFQAPSAKTYSPVLLPCSWHAKNGYQHVTMKFWHPITQSRQHET